MLKEYTQAENVWSDDKMCNKKATRGILENQSEPFARATPQAKVESYIQDGCTDLNQHDHGMGGRVKCLLEKGV